MRNLCARVMLCLAVLMTAGACAENSDVTFDGEQAMVHVQAQCEIGPRWAGTGAIRETARYIRAELEAQGAKVESQTFSYKGVPLENVIGKLNVGKGEPVLLGAHYDTRRLADSDPIAPTEPVLGANDGASGVAVLLELARTLELERIDHELWLAFFDAEDQGGLDGWPWSVGASHMAANLEQRPQYVVIVDMIGDTEQQVYWERNSDPGLQQHVWDIASGLGYWDHIIPSYKYSIIDDHIPFLEQGIVAIDMIDLDYPYWHTTEDTLDKVSAASLERIGRTLEVLLEEQPFSTEE